MSTTNITDTSDGPIINVTSLIKNKLQASNYNYNDYKYVRSREKNGPGFIEKKDYYLKTTTTDGVNIIFEIITTSDHLGYNLYFYERYSEYKEVY